MGSRSSQARTSERLPGLWGLSRLTDGDTTANLDAVAYARNDQRRPTVDIPRQHNDLAVFCDLLKRGSERDAILKIRQLRAGATIQDLIRSPNNGHQLEKHAIALQPWSTLLQGTDSLEDIARFGERLARTPHVYDRLSDVDLLDVFRHRAVGTDAVLRFLLLEDSIPGSVGPTSARRRGTAAVTDGRQTIDAPPVLFSARQWTEVTNNDVFFSQLINVFLSYQNVYWRYVEANELLKALVLRREDKGQYCSPFLLNCEYDEAFVQPGNHVTRGEHFHQEALQLWLLEEGRASLTNLQALVILSMESSFRGKDKLGMTLLSAALSMNEYLPLNPGKHDVYDQTRQKVRQCAAWTTSFVDMTCSLGLMKPSTPLDMSLDESSLDLPSEASIWPGVPFDCMRMLAINTLFHERCKLTRLADELSSMLFGKMAASKSSTELSHRAIIWESNLHKWYLNLPEELQYAADLPAPLFELHGQYHCMMMQYYQHIPRVLRPPGTEATKANDADTTAFRSAVRHAVAAANMLHDYRTRHGFKVGLAFIFQAATLSVSILLQYFAAKSKKPPVDDAVATPVSLPPITSMSSDSSSMDLDTDTPPVQLPPIASLVRDTHSAAFEESYRCLLGLGTQLMIARGVVRVLWLTISSMDIPWLRRRAEELFAEVTGMVWTRGDARMLSSRYPNYVVADGGEREQQMEEILMRWERMGM